MNRSLATWITQPERRRGPVMRTTRIALARATIARTSQRRRSRLAGMAGDIEPSVLEEQVVPEQVELGHDRDDPEALARERLVAAALQHLVQPVHDRDEHGHVRDRVADLLRR